MAVTAIGEDGATTRRRGPSCARRSPPSPDGCARRGSAGDRVVGYLPNSTATVVAFLASASVGAIWAVCAQDYSAEGAAARFGQLEPVVLVAADGYLWNGRAVDRRGEVAALTRALPTLRATVRVPHLGLEDPRIPTRRRSVAGGHRPSRLSSVRAGAVRRAAVGAVLLGHYGRPKGIVHGHGGVLLEHYKLLGLHMDLGPDRPLLLVHDHQLDDVELRRLRPAGRSDDRALRRQPDPPGPQRLWQIAADHGVTVLGLSPGYLLGQREGGRGTGPRPRPRRACASSVHRRPTSRRVVSVGRDHVGRGFSSASITGGTDVVGAFAGSSPITRSGPARCPRRTSASRWSRGTRTAGR